MKFKKICITGADGFIGSHLAEYCVKKGHDVRAFCLYNSFGRPGWLEQSPLLGDMEIFWGDIRDPDRVRQAFAGCDAVLHLAALISIPYSYHSPQSYLATNTQGTLNVLEACRVCEILRLVHTSTSEVYGTAQFAPITEKHPLNAQSPYAASKIGADQLALSFHKSFDLPVSVLRPFNTYGPRQSIRAVIPAIITQLLEGKKEIKLGSLHPTRDFTFVADTVSAFMAVLESDACVGDVVNGGISREISIGDMARLIMDLMNSDAQIICDEKRLRPDKSEVERLLADNSRLRELTGWKPEYGGQQGLRKGIEKTIAWFENGDNLKFYPRNIFSM